MEQIENKNGWGIAALVFAIFSVFFIILPVLGVLFALVGILFSLFASNRIARAGRIVSITALVLNAISLMLFAVAVGAVVNTINNANAKLDDFQSRFDHYDKIAEKSESLISDTCKGTCISNPGDCKGQLSMANCPNTAPICCT